MGLDSVELLFEVEDHFRIPLSDEDCSRVQSVGDLAALVTRELSKVARTCPTAQSFRALRRTAASVTQLERTAMRPRTPLESMVPMRGRRRVWRRLRSANRIVPPLVPSAGAIGFLRTFGWVSFVAWVAGAAALICAKGALGIAFAFLLGLVIGAIWSSTFDVLSTRFPDGCTSLGDVARRITPTPLPEGDPETERRVLDDIRRITAAKCGCKVESVKPESRFVDDLALS